MRRVPWWAGLSAAMAPVFLVGGWTLAAGLQPGGFDSVRDTISALAGLGAADRWVMTAGLAGLGTCHLVTALGLRPAAGAGRLLLAAGGVATVLVAVFPVPRAGTSDIHGLVAGLGFVALALWPALAARRSRSGSAARSRSASAARRNAPVTPGRLDGPVPWGLRPAVSVAAAAVLFGLLGWFVVELTGDGPLVGLTERATAGAQALWPLVVVLTAWSGATPTAGETPAAGRSSAVGSAERGGEVR